MPIRQMTVDEFTAAVATRSPVPGGGAVAAVVAANAAALICMVLEYTVGKPAHAKHESANTASLARARALRDTALDLADRDAAAFSALNVLWKMPKESAARVQSWDATVKEAIDAPQAVLTLAVELARLAASLKDSTNPTLSSDLAIALDLAHVAARAAGHNVAVNLPSVGDQGHRAAAEARMRDTLAAAGAA